MGKNSKKRIKIRPILNSDMKTTIVCTVTFLAFLLANSFSGNVKIYFICQLLLYRQCVKISQLQGAHTKS